MSDYYYLLEKSLSFLLQKSHFLAQSRNQGSLPQAALEGTPSVLESSLFYFVYTIALLELLIDFDDFRFRIYLIRDVGIVVVIAIDFTQLIMDKQIPVGESLLSRMLIRIGERGWYMGIRSGHLQEGGLVHIKNGN